MLADSQLGRNLRRKALAIIVFLASSLISALLAVSIIGDKTPESRSLMQRTHFD